MCASISLWIYPLINVFVSVVLLTSTVGCLHRRLWRRNRMRGRIRASEADCPDHGVKAMVSSIPALAKIENIPRNEPQPSSQSPHKSEDSLYKNDTQGVSAGTPKAGTPQPNATSPASVKTSGRPNSDSAKQKPDESKGQDGFPSQKAQPTNPPAELDPNAPMQLTLRDSTRDLRTAIATPTVHPTLWKRIRRLWATPSPHPEMRFIHANGKKRCQLRMIAGQPPFPNDSDEELLHRHLYEKYYPRLQLQPESITNDNYNTVPLRFPIVMMPHPKSAPAPPPRPFCTNHVTFDNVCMVYIVSGDDPIRPPPDPAKDNTRDRADTDEITDDDILTKSGGRPKTKTESRKKTRQRTVTRPSAQSTQNMDSLAEERTAKSESRAEVKESKKTTPMHTPMSTDKTDRSQLVLSVMAMETANNPTSTAATPRDDLERTQSSRLE